MVVEALLVLPPVRGKLLALLCAAVRVEGGLDDGRRSMRRLSAVWLLEVAVWWYSSACDVIGGRRGATRFAASALVPTRTLP